MAFETIYTNLLDNGFAVCVQEYELSALGAEALHRRQGDKERVLTLYCGRREIARTHPGSSKFFFASYLIELACLIQSPDEFEDVRNQLADIRTREEADRLKSALRTRLTDLLQKP